MGRKAGLVAAVALLFGVMGALAWFAFTRIHHADTRGLASAPRDAIGVMFVDAARVRSYEPVQRLRRAVMSGPDAARDYGALTTACGFDPIDRVDAVTITLDHALIGGNSTDVGSTLLDVRATAAETSQCSSAIAHALQTQIVSTEPMRGHPSLAVVPTGATLGPTSPQIVELPNRVALGTPATLAHLLDVLDRRLPGADRNDLLRTTTASLGTELLAYVVVDAQSALQLVPREMLTLYGQLSALGTAGSAMPAITSIHAAAMALQRVVDGSVRIECVIVYDSDGAAQLAATTMRQGITVMRGPALAALTQSEADFVRRAADLERTDATLAAQTATVRRAYPIIEALVDRVQPRTEGPRVRYDVVFTQREIDTFVDAGIAQRVIDAADARMRAAQTVPMPPPVPPPVWVE